MCMLHTEVNAEWIIYNHMIQIPHSWHHIVCLCTLHVFKGVTSRMYKDMQEKYAWLTRIKGIRNSILIGYMITHSIYSCQSILGLIHKLGVALSNIRNIVHRANQCTQPWCFPPRVIIAQPHIYSHLNFTSMYGRVGVQLQNLIFQKYTYVPRPRKKRTMFVFDESTQCGQLHKRYRNKNSRMSFKSLWFKSNSSTVAFTGL